MASKTKLDDPPSSETIEVSLFGPGYGECCLVHLGSNDWLIVDSCKDQRVGGNPALEYLSAIGVDPAERVKLVIASHAHDDHIAGLSGVVDRCENAEFWTSAALTKDQFFALLEADEEVSALSRHSAYSEFRKITDILTARAGKKNKYPAYQWAIADRPLYRRAKDKDSLEVRVTSLSPSDEAVTRALTYFANQVPVPGEQPRRVAVSDPNTLTCALWIEIGDTCLLLGGDLENGPGTRCGWNAVVESPFRPTQLASVIKVPHHGSSNAHHPAVWDKMLAEQPVAILTPWRHGSGHLPADSDRIRICGITNSAFITANPKPPNSSARTKKIAAQLSTTARNVRELGMAGQIRVRLPNGSSRCEIDLRHPAQRLDS